MNSSWKIAVRNLGRNKRRNFATGLAIAAGYAGLLLLAGYVFRSEKYFRANTVYINHTGHIAIYKEGGLEKAFVKPRLYSLKGEEQKIIEDVVNSDGKTEFIGRYLKGVGLISNGCKSLPFFATGIEPEVEARIRSHPFVTKWVPELAQFKKGKGFWEGTPVDDPVSVTGGLSELLGKPGVYSDFAPLPSGPGTNPPAAVAIDCNGPQATSKVAGDSDVQLVARTFSGDMSALNAEITSHYSTGMAMTEDSSLVAPLSLLQKLYDTDAITYMALYLKDKVSVASYTKSLGEKLKSKGLAVSLYPFNKEEVGLFYLGTMNFLYMMSGFFVCLVFGVVALSIVNSLTMSIIERTKEIGTLRSMGFLPEYVTGLFVKESLALTLSSLVFGALLAVVIAGIVNGLNIRFRPPGVAGDVQFVLAPTFEIGLVLALLISVITYFAARKAVIKRTRENIAKLLTSSSA